MHWAEVVADRLISKGKKHVLATGITPSGPIHIGNMREILTTDAVYRCLLEKGGEADFIYVADDYDPLRRVYPYLPKSYEEHVGKPI
ncbi:MAG: lysine--tRNA ligase, partial [Candidatus Thermoplasmatota archaeon]